MHVATLAKRIVRKMTKFWSCSVLLLFQTLTILYFVYRLCFKHIITTRSLFRPKLLCTSHKVVIKRNLLTTNMNLTRAEVTSSLTGQIFQLPEFSQIYQGWPIKVSPHLHWVRHKVNNRLEWYIATHDNTFFCIQAHVKIGSYNNTASLRTAISI